ncbi:MAG: hypothetical protein JRJ29_10140 [Deltaproteobacteria bacterium]|nr:hypothetical protein [Deltaproteobacteria bacterium]
MRILIFAIGVVFCIAMLTGDAFAVTYGFESGRYGFNPDTPHTFLCNTTLSIDNAQGKPAPSLAVRGNRGMALEVSRQGFTGNFRQAGYNRISLDIKVISWWPNQNLPAPKPMFIIQGANNMKAWGTDAKGFDPKALGQWQHVYAYFNPKWTDTEAQNAGWRLVPSNLAPVSFKETLGNVFVTGFWIQVRDVGAESHYLIDNYALSRLPPHKSLKPSGRIIFKSVPETQRRKLPK